MNRFLMYLLLLLTVHVKIYSFTDIPVLDQRAEAGGFEMCGYHAFKNALIGIGSELPPEKKNLFLSPIIYSGFYDFLITYRFGKEQGERDLDIATLSQALKDFVKVNPKELAPKIRPFHENFINYPNSVSIFNVATADDGNRILGIADPSNLSYLRNLLDISHNQDPFKHAFLIGADSHWTTIIMECHGKGIVSWYGCDSDYNMLGQARSHELLEGNVELLKGTFKNVDDNIIRIYEDAVGADFRRKANWLDDGGGVKVEFEEDVIALLPGSGVAYIDILVTAYDIAQKAGWQLYEDDAVKQGYLKDMKKLALFFMPISTDEERQKLALIM